MHYANTGEHKNVGALSRPPDVGYLLVVWGQEMKIDA